MQGLVALGYALMAGITVTGIAGSLLELVTDRRLGFREPYVSGRNPLRSAATAAIAGPLMLVNEALAARSAGRISALVLASCAATAVVWSTAMGIVVISLALRAASL